MRLIMMMVFGGRELESVSDRRDERVLLDVLNHTRVCTQAWRGSGCCGVV